jgi:hypothetical protein
MLLHFGYKRENVTSMMRTKRRTKRKRMREERWKCAGDEEDDEEWERKGGILMRWTRKRV